MLAEGDESGVTFGRISVGIGAMRFAYTPHKNAIEPQVIDWVERMISVDRKVLVLLDGSMMAARDMSYLKSRGFDFKPALAGSIFDEYGMQGPLIGMLIEPHLESLRVLLQRTDGIPGLSLISSSQSQAQLCERLIWLAKVDTEDGQSLHCRFADTRVLPSLLGLLRPEQHNHLAEVISEWAWIGRDATFEERRIRTTETQKRIADDEPFDLDAKQYERLLNEAEPDMVFQMLAEKMPDVVPEMPPHQTHVRLANMLSSARQYGLADFPDLFQYAVVGLVTQDDFDQNPVLAPTWARIKAGKGRFGELAVQWSEEIWNSLGTRVAAA